ncbi:putative Efflux pump FUS6 [Seiridium unicorne]|uniref:Efflux pump FUS6 n=1 Tax=Seiridium unicorne TaxID=138068 RepID=A0ABR2UIR4_9PEZI
MDQETRDSVTNLMRRLDSPYPERDFQLAPYSRNTQRRNTQRRSQYLRDSMYLRDSIYSLPVNVNETNRWRKTKALQQAKLDPMKGWHLWVTMACLCCGLFLSSVETTIISTSLVSVSASFKDGRNANWIVTAYLVTYTGFLIIFARGIGGAGLYSMAMSVMVEITPFKYIGIASGLLGSIFALSSLLGPVLGGVITSNGDWRWIFYLNGPIGLVILVVVIFIFPTNTRPLTITTTTLSFIDYPGMVLSLLGVVFLVFAVEGGGGTYTWNSPIIITSFAISSVALTGFVAWEWLLSNAKIRRIRMLTLLPIHLLNTRVLGFLFLTAFISGFPFMITIVFLPQRFQLQNGLSAVDAGIRMLPLLLLSATGAGLGGLIASRKNVSWYILSSSLCLQIIALGLMITLPTTGEVSPAQYGYQVLLGMGFGFTLSSFVILARVEVTGEDSGIAIGAITQIRVLGGLIGVAIAQAVLSAQVSDGLSMVLGPDQLSAITQSPEAISQFSPSARRAIVKVYGDAFNLQTKIMIGLSAAGLMACLGAWRRTPTEFVEIKD